MRAMDDLVRAARSSMSGLRYAGLADRGMQTIADLPVVAVIALQIEYSRSSARSSATSFRWRASSGLA